MLRSTLIPVSLSLGLCFVGCNKTETAPAPASGAPVSVAPPSTVAGTDDHAVHAHATEGPHHGPLIELGNEEYHVEVVHDDATGAVTLYLLDAHAEKVVTTTATEAVINLKHGDTPEQFKLAAQPEEGNPAGQTSRFTLTDKELVEHLHEAAAGAKLNITIGDTPYSGSIPAEDHAKHDHGHAK